MLQELKLIADTQEAENATLQTKLQQRVDLELKLQSTESMAERYEQKCTEAQKGSMQKSGHGLWSYAACCSRRSGARPRRAAS